MQKNPVKHMSLTVLLFAAVAATVYFPVFSGKVPLPIEIVRHYPIWQNQGPYSASSFAEISDLVLVGYPFRVFVANTIRAHSLPLWNPFVLAGTPFLGNAQPGVFYPLHAFEYFMPMPIAWSIELILRLFLAAVFMCLFVRSVGASKTGSAVAAIVFACCGFITGWQGLAIGDASIWLPLMCYGVCLIAQSANWRTIGLTALAFAMPVIAGHPETALHEALAVVIFAVISFVPIGKSSKAHAGVLRYAAVAGCLAFGIAAIQVLPTVEWLGQIDHGLQAPWPAAEPGQALGIVSRDIQHQPNASGILIPESGSYVGMLTLLAAPFAAFSNRKRYAIALGAMTILAFLGAFSMEPSHWLIVHTPLLKGLKNSRLILVSSFGLASLAGLGITTIQQGLERLQRRNATIVFTAALLTGLALVYIVQRNTTIRVDALHRPSFSRVLLLGAAVALMTGLWGILRGRYFSVVVCAIAVFDLVTFSYGYSGFADAAQIYPPTPLFDFLKTHLNSDEYRMAALVPPYAYPVNSPMIYENATVDGYDIELRLIQRFMTGLRAEGGVSIDPSADKILRSDDRRLDLLNVKYMVLSTKNPDFEAIAHRFRPVFTAGEVVVVENPSVLPRAFAVPASGIESLQVPEDRFARLTDPTFDPRQSVIVSEPSLKNQESLLQPFSGSVKIKYHDANHYVLESNATAPAILVVSQTYYPGWRATIDGNDTPVFSADLALTGIRIPSGTHQVHLTFQPFSFRAGTTLTLLSLAMIGTFVALEFSAKGGRKWFELPAVATAGAVIILCNVILSRNPSPAPSEGSERRAVIPLTLSDDAASVVIDGDALQDGFAHFGTANTNASGVAILRYAQAAAISETVVPAVLPKRHGIVAFRLDQSFKTALAIANLGTTTTAIRFATDSRTSTRINLDAGHKVTAFLDASPFNVKAASGTLYWESDSPISVTALQTFRDDSHPFLMANLPVADPESLSSASLYLPILTTSQESELSLVNPTEMELKGRVTWFSNSGTRGREEPFVVQARSSLQLTVPQKEGWIRITPTASAFAPEAILTSVLRDGDRADLITVSGHAARTKWSGQIGTATDPTLSIHIINPLPTPAHVALDQNRTISIAPLSTLMISDAIPHEIASESPIAVTMLRTQTSGSKAYVSASYPRVESGASVFPHFAIGQSFSTQFILNGLKDRHGVLRFIGSDGEPLPVKWTTR